MQKKINQNIHIRLKVIKNQIRAQKMKKAVNQMLNKKFQNENH